MKGNKLALLYQLLFWSTATCKIRSLFQYQKIYLHRCQTHLFHFLVVATFMGFVVVDKNWWMRMLSQKEGKKSKPCTRIPFLFGALTFKKTPETFLCVLTRCSKFLKAYFKGSSNKVCSMGFFTVTNGMQNQVENMSSFCLFHYFSSKSKHLKQLFFFFSCDTICCKLLCFEKIITSCPSQCGALTV